MVETLYVLILIPVLLYLFFSVLEIWLVYCIALRGHSRSLLFIPGSTELTHTLLVFAYAQFMVTFSSLLVDIGGELYWPIALLMVTLIPVSYTHLSTSIDVIVSIYTSTLLLSAKISPNGAQDSR